ncbi:NAD(P)/FAD-dependent oxidoreductase [Paracraurococcus lichenis]|uniref:FAD-binding oxidoreductase n=1 Tax=Paracraurococcus lichenis TaxID=3064888 RepID=A0ABT9E907_9PROT|nr:FAD-binding oxidoreductase [Paracraurococcus sp. LOR1-02]MDO9712654.1 FAD-binding oxidoreductase [Paracraurococcus sp. LOR1-02]
MAGNEVLTEAPAVDPVTPDATLPAAVDVVVIGGGIVGASTALFLAEKGLRTALCEKGQIAGEQSSRNWGWCRNTGRDIHEVPLMAESARLWEGMNARLGAETGYRRKGIMYLCGDEAELAKMARWLERAQPFQLGTRLLSTAEVAALMPQSERRWAGALYTPQDGQAEPQRAAPAMAAAARARGAAVLTNCAVRGVETTGGRVAGVVTERGSIRCAAVVLAGGAWSSLFCGSLGLHLPQLKILASVMRTAPLPGAPEIAAGGDGFGYRKRLDGGYTIANLGGEVSEIVPDTLRFLPDFAATALTSWRRLRIRAGRRTVQEARMPRRWRLDAPSPFERIRTLDPAPHGPGLNDALRRLQRAFPVFRQAMRVQQWAGLIDTTPDMIPVISAAETLPGLFIATGFSGHGFGIGPGAGRLMAELVNGDRPVVDPTPFRFARFAESPRPGPSETAL